MTLYHSVCNNVSALPTALGSIDPVRVSPGTAADFFICREVPALASPRANSGRPAMVKSTEGAVKVKKPKTEAMKKRKKLALKEKKRALKAAQPLQPLQPPSKRKRAEDAPEGGQALDDDPAAQPDGAPAEGEKRTRRKKRATAADTAAAELEDTDAPEDGKAPATKGEAAAPGQSTGGAKIACTLFVGQLPYGATANDVSRHFKKFF